MKNYYFTLILSGFLFFLPGKVIMAQVSFGGKPLVESVALPTPPVIDFPAPDMIQIKKEDDLSAEKQQPYRVAIALPANYDFIQSAQKTKVSNGYVWRLILHSTGAKALSVTFSKFNIPVQGKLFLYDTNLKKKIGAFTADNNIETGEMALELVPGETIFLEYFQPSDTTPLPQLVISELLYVYRSAGYDPASTLKNFGQAGSCEVNVNCTEGIPFSNQKQGVVRMFIRAGANAYWCTGSVVSNTNRDFKPYILSASHCMEGAVLSDFSKWIFYFNYEAQSCANPLIEPTSKTISGATFLSAGGNATGQSDFLLVQLNQSIPLDYNTYYFGWSRETTSNPGAVGIHHPEGDIKKISFVLNAPVAVNDYGGTPAANGLYWQVNWRSTTSGFGVTEPGSSGSPLINKDGQIIGTLSGGGSDCAHTSAMDYYGKVSAHWTSDGSTITTQLGPWLDPQKIGFPSLAGGYNNNNVIPQLAADAVIIPPDFAINFTDLSLGNPTQWNWTFAGATPSTSNAKNPSGIRYNKTGNFDVKLTVANSFQRDSLVLKGYIQVKAQVYPNPTRGLAELFISKDLLPQFDVIINNVEGMQVNKFTAYNTNKVSIDLSNQRSGIYFITVITTGNTQTYKIVVTR